MTHAHYEASQVESILREIHRRLAIFNVEGVADYDPIRGIYQELSKLNNKLEALAMALTPQVQQLVDDVRQNKDLAASCLAALAAESTQITALQTQVTGLQSQLAGGGTISTEDLTALQGAITQLEETNTSLSGGGTGGAVTANTTATATTDTSAPASAAPSAGTTG